MAELKDDVGNMKTRISSSRFSGVERRFDTMAADSKHGSKDNSKCHEADMQSSEGGTSTQPASVKSEISVETHLPVRNGSHESLAAESSCSNSLPIVLPVSFSNQSCQETSKEANLFRNCGSSMDSSNERSPQEPVTASSESGISAQIARKAIRNAKERNSMKVSAMAGNHRSKGDEEISRKWDHVTATPEDDVAEVSEQTEMCKWMIRNACTVGKSCVSYDNIDSSFNCTKTAESTHCRERRDKISREVENEYSESLMKKPRKYAVKDQDKSFAGFDLNEDVNMNMMDDFIQPVGETVSSHSLIHVVAKAATLIGHPRIPLKFEGGSGWKGPAETSAFRPASLSKSSNRKGRPTDHVPKDELCSTGFDLNVAAIDGNEGVSSPHALQDSHSEVDSKQTGRLLFDLNCLYDANDEFTPPKPENRVDLSSNALTSVAEKSNGLHWLPQGNKISNTCYPGRQDFDQSDFATWTNLNAMRHLVNGNPTLGGAPNFLQPFEIQRAASTQLMTPPPGYMYKDPFHFGAGSIPYARFYGNTPHLQQVVHEQNTSHISASIPKFFDVKTEDSSSISGSNPRHFQFLTDSSPMEEHMHQEAWYAASMKRKEPEGGYECYQLGYKQVL
ncbi:hypothetical protein ACS0TY_027993 [Phlomoides rotata]